MPLFSVIVTVYNLEKYIAQCLESLVDQDFHDYEVIVVDNGSSDRSIEICQEYIEKYPQLVRLISLGQPSVMHRGHKAGLDAARGDYIHIMDGDDYVRKGYLHGAAEIIANQAPDVIIGRFSSFTEGNALPSRDAVLERERIDDCHSEEVIHYIGTMPAYHLAFWRYIFKRSLVDGSNLFESRFKENQELPILDALVTFRILLSASSYALLEEPFYYYRHRGSSLTAPNARQVVWHAQSFSEFLMLLHEKGFQGEKRAFILAKLRQELKLMLGRSDLWTEKIVEKIVRLLEKARIGMDSLSGEAIPDSLKRFWQWIRTCETIDNEALSAYFEVERNRVLDTVKRQAAEEIFVFPCGQFARDVQRWLVQAGFSQVHFLDNNPDMNGRIVQGSRCYTPDALALHTSEKLENALICIATIYEELDELLVQQCKEIGLLEERILICWP